MAAELERNFEMRSVYCLQRRTSRDLIGGRAAAALAPASYFGRHPHGRTWGKD